MWGFALKYVGNFSRKQNIKLQKNFHQPDSTVPSQNKEIESKGSDDFK